MSSLSITSVAPYFIIMGLCFVVANRIDWLLPERYYAGHSVQKHQAINGIRSILAMSVFFHHAVISYYFYQHGRWEIPPSPFFTLLGQVSVGVFFAITGFLFWEKAINSGGMVSYRSLMISRVKRIAPAYMLAASIILGVIAWESSLTINVPVEELLRRSASFLFSLGTLSRHPINGIDPNPMGAGVFWTLQYEWRFYLALPLLATLLRNRVVTYIAFAVLISALLYKIASNYSHMPISALFLSGIFTAHLYSNPVAHNALTKSRLLPILGIVALSLLFSFCNTLYSYVSVLLMFVFFIALIHIQPNNPLYQLLLTKPAKLLGAVSYSTYILHGIVLYLSFSIVNKFFPIKQFTPFQFWGLTGCIAISLVFISSLSYRYVEHPFLKPR